MAKPILFTGFQPTGNLHIGNYLGAVKNFIDLQNSGKYQCYLSIVDYHSLTGNMSAKERKEQITKMAAELLAAGVDPEKSVFFVQSHVPEHTELAWIFNTITPVAELERMTQFKDKSERQAKNINTGLFTYPVLQAADILLYHGTHVPVGEDQVQHVELTRDVARWFNNRYSAKKKYFPETEAILTKTPRVMSLLEPEKKMSKSLGEGHVIELADEPAVINKKIRKAVTATTGGKKMRPPGVDNLFILLREFAGETMHSEFDSAEKEGKIKYGELKEAVTDAISIYFEDFRGKRAEFLDHHEEIAEILISGAEKAREVAEKTMNDVRKFVGIR